MDLINFNMQKLKSIRIKEENIMIWFYKPYQDQCNMEFTPQDMKRMADSNVSLCISWLGGLAHISILFIYYLGYRVVYKNSVSSVL